MAGLEDYDDLLAGPAPGGPSVPTGLEDYDDLLAAPPQQKSGWAYKAPAPDAVAEFKSGPATPDNVSALQAGLMGGADAFSFGFDDELTGVGNWIKNRGASGSYTTGRDRQRLAKQAAQEEHPGAYLTGQVGGGVAQAVVPGAAAVKGASLLDKTAKAAYYGQLGGGLYGIGSADGDMKDRALGATKGAAVGAVTGAAGPLFGKVIGSVTGKLPDMFDKPVQYAQTLKNNIYQKIRDAQVVLKREGADRVWERLNGFIKNEKANPSLHGGTISTLRQWQSANHAMSLDELEALRGRLGEISAQDSPDGALASKVRREIDDVIRNIQGDDVISLTGESPGKVVRLMQDAREANTRYRNTQTIGRLITQAKSSSQAVQSGDLEGALRNAFTPLYRNERKMNFLSKHERGVVEKIVMQPTSKAKTRLINDLTRKFTFGIADTPGEAVGAVAGGAIGSTLGMPTVMGVPIGALAGAAAGVGTVKGIKRAAGIGAKKERMAEDLLQNTARDGVPVRRNALPAQKKATAIIGGSSPAIQDKTPDMGGSRKALELLPDGSVSWIDPMDYLREQKRLNPRNFPPAGIRG